MTEKAREGAENANDPLPSGVSPEDQPVPGPRRLLLGVIFDVMNLKKVGESRL